MGSLTRSSVSTASRSTSKPGSANAIVNFRVTNTGKLAGAEVAQLYLGFPPIAEGNEPPLQLKGFRKIMPESRRVEAG